MGLVKMVSFSVPGTPKGKARPRVTMYGTYTPKATKDYEAKIRAAFRDAGGELVDSDYIIVQIRAYFEPPKSSTKKFKKHVLDFVTPYTKKPDYDNIAKTLDALNGIAWVDDSKIAYASISKEYADKSELVVSITWKDLDDGSVL